MKKLRHAAEYAGARITLALCDRLTAGQTLAFARRLADMWFIVDRERRQTAISNIITSGIETHTIPARYLARESFRHMACVVVETLKIAPIIANEDTRRLAVEIDIHPDTMTAISSPGRGVIVVSGHIGNWEIAAKVLSFFKPVVGVTRPMNNPMIERLIQQRKPQGRFTLTPKHDANAGRFLEVLSQGNILALLLDQHAPDMRYMIPFFGRPAATHGSAAMLHLVTGAPLCFGYCLRTGPMQFRITAKEPITVTRSGRRQRDVEKILSILSTELEKTIRLAPAQYLWAHRRWRDNQMAKQMARPGGVEPPLPG